MGSTNKGKIDAVKLCFNNYDDYKHAEVVGINIDSKVSNQPIGLDEIITGAKNRAKGAYEASPCVLGVGIEAGIFLVPHTKSDYMDTTACVLYDGKSFHIGLSSCFEYPKHMINLMLTENKEVSDAAVELGFAKDRGFRENLGMVGVLTRGVVDRVAFSEQAVHMAIIHLLNKEHY